jgi:hypothetical protein
MGCSRVAVPLQVSRRVRSGVPRANTSLQGWGTGRCPRRAPRLRIAGRGMASFQEARSLAAETSRRGSGTPKRLSHARSGLQTAGVGESRPGTRRHDARKVTP